MIPKQLGTEADWAAVSTMQHRAVLRKADGRAWVSPPFGPRAGSLLPGTLSVQRLPQVEDYQSVTELFGNYGQLLAGIRLDGTLRITAGHISIDSHGRVRHSSELTSLDVILNAQTNWLSLAGSRNSVVSLRDDGTLWIWTLPENRTEPLLSRPVKRLSGRSEWIGIAPCLNGVAALATDGSIWFWELEPTASQHLLALSRRPRLLSNVTAEPPFP
jgi:hypothetical protein